MRRAALVTLLAALALGQGCASGARSWGEESGAVEVMLGPSVDAKVSNELVATASKDLERIPLKDILVQALVRVRELAKGPNAESLTSLNPDAVDLGWSVGPARADLSRGAGSTSWDTDLPETLPVIPEGKAIVLRARASLHPWPYGQRPELLYAEGTVPLWYSTGGPHFALVAHAVAEALAEAVFARLEAAAKAKGLTTSRWPARR